MPVAMELLHLRVGLLDVQVSERDRRELRVGQHNSCCAHPAPKEMELVPLHRLHGPQGGFPGDQRRFWKHIQGRNSKTFISHEYGIGWSSSL